MHCPTENFESACIFAPILIIALIAFGILFLTAVSVLFVWAWCRIFSKAGYNWALGLLMMVPFAKTVAFFVLAFSDWPIAKEMRLLKQPPNIQQK